MDPVGRRLCLALNKLRPSPVRPVVLFGNASVETRLCFVMVPGAFSPFPSDAIVTSALLILSQGHVVVPQTEAA